MGLELSEHGALAHLLYAHFSREHHDQTSALRVSYFQTNQRHDS